MRLDTSRFFATILAQEFLCAVYVANKQARFVKRVFSDNAAPTGGAE